MIEKRVLGLITDKITGSLHKNINFNPWNLLSPLLNLHHPQSVLLAPIADGIRE
jgi:hypothetical protein